MAIKRAKTKKSDVEQLPEKLDGLLRDGFTCSVLQKKFEEDGKEIRGEVVTYLESNTDGFEVEVSKSFKTEYGAVNFKQRQNFEVDKDALIELVNSGKITIETLVHLGSFAGAKLKEAGCGVAVSDGDPTEYLELRPNKEFKEKVDVMWASGDIAEPVDLEEEIEASRVARMIEREKQRVKKGDAKVRAAAAAAKARAKAKATVDVDDDLDAILGE